LIPVIPITLPSLETVVTLTEWLYLRRTTRLERFLVPPALGAELSDIMRQISLCSGLWSNAAVLGILNEDEELATCLQNSWMALRARLLARVREEQVSRGDPRR
jgi:hypothetical protein